MLLWQHQGRLVYGTPNISRPATAGTNSLRLSWHVLAGVRPLFAPRERAASNLQKPVALQHFCWQLPWNVQLHESPYRIGRRQGYQGPRCSTSSSVDSGNSARKKKTTTDNCTMERQDSPRPRSSWPTRKTYGTISNGTCQIQDRHRHKQGSQSRVVSTTWNTLSSGVANPKEIEGRPEWALLSKGYRHKADRNATARKWQNHNDETTSEQGQLCYNCQCVRSNIDKPRW